MSTPKKDIACPAGSTNDPALGTSERTATYSPDQEMELCRLMWREFKNLQNRELKVALVDLMIENLKKL